MDCIIIKAIHKHERRDEKRAARKNKEKNQILMDKQFLMFAVNNKFVCFTGDKWWK